MEASTDLNNLDAVAIVEDDQQLYDWGIEHRLDQYYGNPEQQQQQYQLYQQQLGKAGYVLPEHVQQQENSYLVTISDNDSTNKKAVSQLIVKAESTKGVRSIYSTKQMTNIKPNGVPGRRPILPTVDMDANEILKVSNSVKKPNN